MPRPVLFVPCERVIVNAKDQTLSLITVLENVQFYTDADEVPSDAVMDVTWSAVTIWLRDDADQAQRFEQRLHVIAPDGRISTDAVMTFDLTAQPRIRNIVEVSGFPVAPPGIFILRLSLREAGKADDDWQHITDYPLPVQWRTPKPE